jgi:hypothetical protein
MTVCWASGGKIRWASRPGQILQGRQTGDGIDFFLPHHWRGLIPRKALTPLLHQIPRRADLVSNRLIGQPRVRQQQNTHPPHRLLGRFPRPLQGF